jgi:hypothetical protein
MKTKKVVKSTKLTQSEMKRGFKAHRGVHAEEVPIRKLDRIEFWGQVQHGRKAFYATNFGKRVGLIVPLPLE